MRQDKKDEPGDGTGHGVQTYTASRWDAHQTPG